MITFTKSDLNFLLRFHYWWDDMLYDHQMIPRPKLLFFLPQYIVLVSDGEVEMVTIDWLVKEANDAWLAMGAHDRVAFLNFHQAQKAYDMKWEMMVWRRKEAKKLLSAS